MDQPHLPEEVQVEEIPVADRLRSLSIRLRREYVVADLHSPQRTPLSVIFFAGTLTGELCGSGAASACFRCAAPRIGKETRESSIAGVGMQNGEPFADVSAVSSGHPSYRPESAPARGTPQQQDPLMSQGIKSAQVERSASRSFGGPELRPSVATRLADLIGGGLSAARVVGKGTTFVLRLPRSVLDSRPE